MRFFIFIFSILISVSIFSQKKTVLCIGAHPDDPESGCGGTLYNHVMNGDSVIVLYLTKGEAGIPNTSHSESANIRVKEARCASDIIGYKPVFFGQIDGDSEVNNQHVEKMVDLLNQINPDIVYTHWPLDSHKDHQVASLLTTQAWYRCKKKFDVYFFEVCLGYQTTLFHPNTYIDITNSRAKKHEAIECHKSQNPHGILHDKDCNHFMMELVRGQEMTKPAAESFIKWR